MAAAITGLAACWESITSRIPVSALAVAGDTLYVVETDYVERVNTRNFPETQSPQLLSASHRVLTHALGAADATPFAAYAGPLESKASATGDTLPYLLVDTGGVAVWDRNLLRDHLSQAVKAACPQGQWFDRPLLSAPLFFACAGDTAVYRFDDASGASCRVDTAALATLPRFSPEESPIERILAHHGDDQVLIEAAGRFFRAEGCAGGALAEFDPFASLPAAYRPVPRPQGQVSPPPYTELADAWNGHLLFTSGVTRERPDVLLVVAPGAEVLRIPLPEALRASPTTVAGPWLVADGTRVLWQITLPDNRAEVMSLRLQDLHFERHAVAGS